MCLDLLSGVEPLGVGAVLDPRSSRCGAADQRHRERDRRGRDAAAVRAGSTGYPAHTPVDGGQALGLALVRGAGGLGAASPPGAPRRTASPSAPVRPRAPAESLTTTSPKRFLLRPIPSSPRPSRRWLPGHPPTGPRWPRRQGPTRTGTGRASCRPGCCSPTTTQMAEYLQRLLAGGYQVAAIADGRASTGQRPGRSPGPGDERRDDAGPGRAAAGRRPAGELRRPRTCPCCCCGRARRPLSRAWKRPRTTTWSKPFFAELLARVRANVRTCHRRLRQRARRWRATWSTGLHEGFFLADAQAA